MRKAWISTSSRRTKAQAPDSIKRKLQEEADKLIEDRLKPEHIKPPTSGQTSNYLTDIYSKWHGNYFYFCATYNCPSPNAISPSFETKFARMEYMGNERFNLSYMRHTEKWLEIRQSLPIPECLHSIAEEPQFIP